MPPLADRFGAETQTCLAVGPCPSHVALPAGALRGTGTSTSISDCSPFSPRCHPSFSELRARWQCLGLHFCLCPLCFPSSLLFCLLPQRIGGLQKCPVSEPPGLSSLGGAFVRAAGSRSVGSICHGDPVWCVCRGVSLDTRGSEAGAGRPPASSNLLPIGGRCHGPQRRWIAF